MSDRKTLIVYLKITYEKHWEKISIALMVLAGIIMVMVAVVIGLVLVYKYYFL